MDTAAAAVVEARMSPASYIHLRHPKPVTWTSIIETIAKYLHVPVVSYGEWLEKLNCVVEGDELSTADREEAAQENPAIRLIDVYRNAGAHIAGFNGNHEQEALIRITFDVDVSKKVIKTLGDPNLPTLGDPDVKHWLAYWTDIGVLHSRSRNRL